MAKNVTTETGLRQRIDFLTSSMRSEREERTKERRRLLDLIRAEADLMKSEFEDDD
jgi:hypothetical protein